MEVTITRGTKRMNANYKGSNKAEQNKIYSSNFKMWLGSTKTKKGIIANEIQ